LSNLVSRHQPAERASSTFSSAIDNVQNRTALRP
jgi:hypothetical protein